MSYLLSVLCRAENSNGGTPGMGLKWSWDLTQHTWYRKHHFLTFLNVSQRVVMITEAPKRKLGNLQIYKNCSSFSCRMDSPFKGWLPSCSEVFAKKRWKITYRGVCGIALDHWYLIQKIERKIAWFFRFFPSSFFFLKKKSEEKKSEKIWKS